MYHSFLIHSSADGHLGCFHVLAIVNRSTVIFEKWEVNEASSVVIQSYSLKKMFKCCTGRGSQVEPPRLSEFQRWN